MFEVTDMISRETLLPITLKFQHMDAGSISTLEDVTVLVNCLHHGHPQLMRKNALEDSLTCFLCLFYWMQALAQNGLTSPKRTVEFTEEVRDWL